MRPCYIAGSGLVTAQGVGIEANWNALFAGAVLHQTGLVPIDRDKRLARVSQLAILAANDALAKVPQADLSAQRTALIVGTSKGPIEDWLAQLDGRRTPDIQNGIAQVAVDVAAAVGHSVGPRLTYAGACASGLHAMIRAADLIRQGACDQALVIAAEASTHALFQANFARLGVLADPTEGCRPFDTRRRGFLLAEAAAAVWLTSTSGQTPAICLESGKVLADAAHLTAPDPDAVALRELLSELTSDSSIDLVHAHGTGTIKNDKTELLAIASTLKHSSAAVYSHKHAIGHTQGAAGLIGVVLNVEMHCRRYVLGNANSEEALEADDGCSIAVPYVRVPKDFKSSLVVCAGFGGTLAGVRLGYRS